MFVCVSEAHRIFGKSKHQLIVINKRAIYINLHTENKSRLLKTKRDLCACKTAKKKKLESRRRQPISSAVNDDAAAAARSASVLVLKGTRQAHIYVCTHTYICITDK